jgi:ubiquinone/menaquinone biosynthesis C-methylase UbiE
VLRSLADLCQGGRLSLVQADAQRLPLPDDCVDVAMAMHMLYHVPDVATAISELRRITRPDGIVLASTNSSAHLAEIAALVDAAACASPPLRWSASRSTSTPSLTTSP